MPKRSNAKKVASKVEVTKPIRPPIPPKETVLASRPKETSGVGFWPRGWRTLKRLSPLLWVALIGFIAGVVWLVALRFFLIHPKATHYHANFAVYINGKREPFKSFAYYEEIAACSADYANNPKGRVHMHDSINSVVHVHDQRVTWEDFFANLDWSLGKNFLQTDQGMYQPTDDHQLVFILNGARVARVDNKIIGDQDKLLISYDVTGTDFMSQYATIENEAAHFDATPDPASCSGLNGPEEASFSHRLKRAIGFSGE